MIARLAKNNESAAKSLVWVVAAIRPGAIHAGCSTRVAGAVGFDQPQTLFEVAGLDRPDKAVDHQPLWNQRSRCFCCFCRKLSATHIAFAAEILEFRRCGGAKNSGKPRAGPL